MRSFAGFVWKQKHNVSRKCRILSLKRTGNQQEPMAHLRLVIPHSSPLRSLPCEWQQMQIRSERDVGVGLKSNLVSFFVSQQTRSADLATRWLHSLLCGEQHDLDIQKHADCQRFKCVIHWLSIHMLAWLCFREHKLSKNSRNVLRSITATTMVIKPFRNKAQLTNHGFQLTNTHFPALGIGCVFSRARHGSRVSVLFSAQFVVLLSLCILLFTRFLWLRCLLFMAKKTFPHLLIDLQPSCKDFRNVFGQLWAKKKRKINT